MVARAGSPIRSANAGELSPGAGGRVDIKQFYSAGLRFKNVEPVPLSGWRRMAGSLDLGRVRETVALFTYPDPFPNPGPHTGTQTIWETSSITGSHKIVAVHCSAIDSSTGIHSVRAQVLVGAIWQNLGNPIDIGTEGYAITFAAAPGEGITGSQVRLRATMSGSASITCGTVTLLEETGTQERPRYFHMLHDDGDRYSLSLQLRMLDIYLDDAFVGAAYLPEVNSAGRLRQCNFYAENATIGIGQRNMQTYRVRRAGSAFKWVIDLWPYDTLPKVDLGGTYTKTADKWVGTIRWSGDAASIRASMEFTINGETTPALPWLDAGGAETTLGGWNATQTQNSIKAAIEALPSMTPSITVTITAASGGGKWREIAINFGGMASGKEYQVTGSITNTTDASLLMSHTQIGMTDFEPLFSASAGWPGVFGLVQDRLLYGDIKSEPAAIAMSQVGEYFKLDIDQAGANAPRLDRLRSQAAERVLAFAEATYLLAFTNRAAYFAANRTINATDPLNYTRIATSGIVANTEAVQLDTRVFYVGRDPDSTKENGQELLSLSFTELENTFEAVPEHIFASHLVDGITRIKGQYATNDADASKVWLMRDDGRLVASCVIVSQEISGFCEWVVADTGQEREIHVDARNNLRMCVERGGVLRHERQDRDIVLQSALSKTSDLAGQVTGLQHLAGRTVWVHNPANNRYDGPLVVSGGGTVTTVFASTPVNVGLWQAPVWESMPRYYINRNDEVIKRPGRIAAATIEIIETQNIAVGANGQTPEDVLANPGSGAVAYPKTTGKVRRIGMLGHKVGTTLVATQTRPGEFQVRDMTLEESL